MVRRPNQAVRNQEPALAMKPRQLLIRPSWKEKSWLMPASVEEISGVSRYHIPWRGTLTLEEECGLVGDEVTGEVLRGVHQASDGCAPQVRTLEQVK
jgi:hypothetical protein